MKTGKRNLLYLLTGILLLALLAGCGSKESSGDSETDSGSGNDTEEASEEKTAPKAIGTEGQGEDTYVVKIKNVTGQDVTGVAVKDIDAKEFPGNLLEDGDVFAADEERNLFWTKEEKDEEDEDPDGKMLIPGYDVSVTLADGNSFVLHAFPFEEMREGELHVEDGVAFLTYVCEVNTKEAEIMTKQQEERAAEKAAKKKAAEKKAAKEKKEAEKAAAEAAAAEEAAAQAAAAEEAAAQAAQQQQQPAQSSEQCIGDGGLTY